MDHESVEYDEIAIARHRGRYAIIIKRDNGNRATIWDDEGIAEGLYNAVSERYDELLRDVVRPVLGQCSEGEDSSLS